MKKIIFVLLLFALVAGCARHPGSYSEHRDGKIVRSGVLKQGIDMQAFLDVWGPPERTRVITINSQDQGLSAKWNRFGGKFTEGKQYYSYQEWNYERFGIDLLFDGNDLVNWKTDKTVAELRALAKPLPDSN